MHLNSGAEVAAVSALATTSPSKQPGDASKNEAQDVGWIGIVQKLIVQQGNGGIVDNRHADFGVDDLRATKNSTNRPTHANAVNRKTFLTVGNVNGDQGK